jgi:signal transduction histidine kinase
MQRWHRRLSSARGLTKQLTALTLIAVVGYVDLIVGEEISFAIFYMLPITYAAWFISSHTGIAIAALSAATWYSVEVTQHPPFSHDWIPVWNAAVRFAFFSVGVGLVRMIRSTEARLLREVSRKTRSLRMESDRRRQLERELVEVTAREQVRFTQDLHDGIGQYLSALAFHARILSDELRELKSPQAAQAERIVEIIRTTNQMIRRLDRALRVPDEADVTAAIRTLAGEFQQLTGIRCELELTQIPEALDPFCVLMLYRIVQEALNNAVKHGNPRSVKISTVVTSGVLHARVVDDGAGLSGKSEPGSGSGLRNMKLRAELIGGHVSLLPNANAGCTVECVLPLAADAMKIAT